MMSRLDRFHGCAIRIALAIAAFGFAASARAGVERHDRPDFAYRGLAAEFNNVGKILGSTGTSNYLGSGTLVADNWVLTAGHVVDDAKSLDFIIGGQHYDAAKWIAHPQWDGNLSNGFDIALVQLATPVTGIEPAERFHGGGELGRVATSVGFGRGGNGVGGATTTAGIERAGQNVLDSFAPGSGGRVLISDFDDPTFGDAAFLSGSPVQDLEYLIAPGDSGGGLFLNSTSGPLLAGVHSFGAARDGTLNSDYGDFSGHIRVSSFNNWIDRTIGLGTSAAVGPSDLHSPLVDAYQSSVGSVIPTPEPSSIVLVTLGVVAMLTNRQRRRNR